MRMKDIDRNTRLDNGGTERKQHIRSYEFTEDEEMVVIEALRDYEGSRCGYSIDDLRLARYMIDIYEEHTGNDE